MIRVAGLDFGTNTFLLLIADVEDGQIERIVHDEVRVVRLGQGVHQNRCFHPEALQRAEECLREFSQIIDQSRVEKIRACATSAARDVTNADELMALASRYKIPLQVIAGDQEAKLTFSGTFSEPLKEPVLVVDVGGGSTEFIYGDKNGIIARKSVDIGSVRLTELFVTKHPISSKELEMSSAYISARMQALRGTLAIPPGVKPHLVAVAGTPTTLAAMDQGIAFDPKKIDGYRLQAESLRDWVQRLAGMSVEERQAISGMEPKRADVIVAGGMILEQTCQMFAARQLIVSTRGLRYGIALELAQKG